MAESFNVLLLVDTSGEYDRGLLKGIADFCRLRGQWSFHGSFGVPIRDVLRNKNFKPDGIIARYMHDVTDSMMGLPMVVCKAMEETVGGVSAINVQSDIIGEMAAEHFFDRGFKNFAFCGRKDKYWSLERGESFCERIKKAGFETQVYNESITSIKGSWSKRQIRLVSWLKSLPKPLGLLASNDNLAQHVLQACREAEIKVPDEVAILGVDNDELICNLSNPSLSSVQLSFERAGYEAAELLDDLMRSNVNQPKQIIVQPLGIKLRQSTEILAIEDEDVREALRFIRGNFNELIGVVDVLDHVALSRRSLELKFRKLLGRSINSEIRRVRVEHACRLLSETNMPIKKIAQELGYPDTTHIARYFRIEKSLSLQQYRQEFGMR